MAVNVEAEPFVGTPKETDLVAWIKGTFDHYAYNPGADNLPRNVLIFVSGISMIRYLDRELDPLVRRHGYRKVLLHGDLPVQESDIQDNRILKMVCFYLGFNAFFYLCPLFFRLNFVALHCIRLILRRENAFCIFFDFASDPRLIEILLYHYISVYFNQCYGKWCKFA